MGSHSQQLTKRHLIYGIEFRWFCLIIVLWLASLVLLLLNIGNLPLRDWDESLVARVALEMSERPWPQNSLPTLWFEPYLNKPPLLHSLIAAAIASWRSLSPAETSTTIPPEWLIRTVPALLSSLVVLLVPLVQARLRPGDHLAAVASAGVAVSLLPLMRHGRLAMLDGTLISAMTLQWWALLSISHQPDAADLRRWGALAGLASAVILMIKAPAAFPLMIGGFALLAFEHRWSLKIWTKLLLWVTLGILPGVIWHIWHGWSRGGAALTMWGSQGMARVLSIVEGHDGGILVPIREIFQGGWPWLALWPFAILWAFRQRRSRWGYWVLGLTLLTSGLVLPLRTQLPWYSHLLWPSFTLAVAPVLASLISGTSNSSDWSDRALRWVPLCWVFAGILLAVAPDLLPSTPVDFTRIKASAIGIGGALLLIPSMRWKKAGAITLIFLLWLAMLALFSGPHWMWLGKAKRSRSDPSQLAELIKQLPAEQQELRIIQERYSPSLSWYLGRQTSQANIKHELQNTNERSIIVITRKEPVPAESRECSQSLLPTKDSKERLFICNKP